MQYIISQTPLIESIINHNIELKRQIKSVYKIYFSDYNHFSLQRKSEFWANWSKWFVGFIVDQKQIDEQLAEIKRCDNARRSKIGI